MIYFPKEGQQEHLLFHSDSFEYFFSSINWDDIRSVFEWGEWYVNQSINNKCTTLEDKYPFEINCARLNVCLNNFSDTFERVLPFVFNQAFEIDCPISINLVLSVIIYSYRVIRTRLPAILSEQHNFIIDKFSL